MRSLRAMPLAVIAAAALLLGQSVHVTPAHAFEGSVDLNTSTPFPIGVYPSCVLVVDGYAYVSDGSNGSPSYVSVVRVSDGAVTAWLPAGSNSAGIASAYGKVFVVAPYGQDVTVIDSSSKTVVSTISNAGTTPTGGTLVPWAGPTTFANPIGIQVGTVNNHQYLYVANIYSGVTVIDADTNLIVSTIDVPGENWGLAVDGNYAYVPDRYGATVTVLDITKAVNDPAHAVISTIPLPANSKPVSGVVAEGYLYVTDWHNGSVDLLDVSKAVTDPMHSYTVTRTIGSQPFGGTYYNGRIYISNGGDNTVSVIDPTTQAVLDPIASPDFQGPGGGLAGDNGVLYVPSNGNHLLVGVSVGSAPDPSPAPSSDTSDAPAAAPTGSQSPAPLPSAIATPEPSATEIAPAPSDPEPLNGQTAQRIAGLVSLVSSGVARQTTQRFMISPPSQRIGRAPRVSGKARQPLALVLRGLTPDTKYVMQIKGDGIYTTVGTVASSAGGTLALPVMQFDRGAEVTTVALLDPEGYPRYIKVLVQ